MALKHKPAASGTIAKHDPIWSQIRQEAQRVLDHEPSLGSFVYGTVLSHDHLEAAIIHRLAQRLDHQDSDAGHIARTFAGILRKEPKLGEIFRADLAAVFERDPACERYLEPLLYYKGFHALANHRFAHELWKQGRKDFALYLQSQTSKLFAVDIHPAAQFGKGIMLDHATGIVIGQTAVIGDNCSFLHGVTLGGSGKATGTRHPNIGTNVLIGAGAKLLGNIKVGDCSLVAAGSVVLTDVPANRTVAGVPAKDIGPANCPEPATTMEQQFGPKKCC